MELDKSLFDVSLILKGYATGFYTAENLSWFIKPGIITQQQYYDAVAAKQAASSDVQPA